MSIRINLDSRIHTPPKHAKDDWWYSKVKTYLKHQIKQQQEAIERVLSS
jgi:hypothetical protein